MSPHESVLLDEVIAALLPEGAPVARIIDGTLGAGGHSRALLAAGVACVLGLDLDPQALALARENLHVFGERAVIVQASYRQMREEASRLGWSSVDGILLDVGVSSMQMDTPERGFAFRHDAPLDMRFTAADGRAPAAHLVNHWAESDLSEIFFTYGEERHARRIARAIVAQRPIETTRQLADLVAANVPREKRREGQIHPATRIFQALRIAVNDELGVLSAALPEAIDLLRPGGRLAVISFHSLEDRIVKQVFKEAATEIVAPPGMASLETRSAQVRLVTRKPITPTDAEITRNPRSRSAKLRVVEKL